MDIYRYGQHPSSLSWRDVAQPAWRVELSSCCVRTRLGTPVGLVCRREGGMERTRAANQAVSGSNLGPATCHCVTLTRYLPSLRLGFLTCNTGEVTVPTCGGRHVAGCRMEPSGSVSSRES